MSAARNQAPLMDLADLDLGDLLPPDMQQPRRISSGVFTRPVVPHRSSFTPGPIGTRLPSQPPALVLAKAKKSSSLLNVFFAAAGFLVATTIVTYLLYR